MKQWEKSEEVTRFKSNYKASPFPKEKTGGSKKSKFSDAEPNLQQSFNLVLVGGTIFKGRLKSIPHEGGGRCGQWDNECLPWPLRSPEPCGDMGASEISRALCPREMGSVVKPLCPLAHRASRQWKGTGAPGARLDPLLCLSTSALAPGRFHFPGTVLILMPIGSWVYLL